MAGQPSAFPEKMFDARAFEALGYRVASIDIDACYEKCVVTNANDPLPFRDGVFDVVWSSEVIEHLEDPAFAIREMRRRG